MLGQLYVLVDVIGQAKDLLSSKEAHILEPIQIAAWRTLIIGLAGMYSTDQESITVSYLLDLASNHPYDFKHATPQKVKYAVEKSRAEIESVGDFGERMRTIRDRRLAHLDRKHVNEPQSMIDIQLSIEEAGTALTIVETIIRRFSEASGLELAEFDQSKAEYKSSLTRLLKNFDDQGFQA
jgi:hypothetical protein